MIKKNKSDKSKKNKSLDCLLSHKCKFFFCRTGQIELFHALAAISAEHNLGVGVLVKIKFNIIASLYDYNPNMATFMKVGNSFLYSKEALDLADTSLARPFKKKIFFKPSSAGNVEEVSGLHR